MELLVKLGTIATTSVYLGLIVDRKDEIDRALDKRIWNVGSKYDPWNISSSNLGGNAYSYTKGIILRL